MFKKYLADFALESGLEISVCRYPPGCSKYNKDVISALHR